MKSTQLQLWKNVSVKKEEFESEISQKGESRLTTEFPPCNEKQLDFDFVNITELLNNLKLKFQDVDELNYRDYFLNSCLFSPELNGGTLASKIFSVDCDNKHFTQGRNAID